MSEDLISGQSADIQELLEAVGLKGYPVKRLAISVDYESLLTLEAEIYINEDKETLRKLTTFFKERERKPCKK